MRILIFAVPRTGGTYLGNYLSNRYNLPYFQEPPIMEEFPTMMDNLDEFCIKIVTTQLYYYNEKNKKLSDDDCINYFYNLLSKYKFDKILFLDRLNEIEHIEAVINLQRRNPHNTAFEDWTYNDEFKNSITTDEWNYWKTYTLNAKKWLNLLSSKFNIPVIYYEDVYYNTETVDLQGLEFIPDLSKKYRKNIPRTTI